MLDISDSIGKHGGALLKTGLGVVVALCFIFMEMQRRNINSMNEARTVTETKLFELFTNHNKDMKDTARNQWQNQQKIADALNAIAINVATGLARIEATLHIPPDKRGPMTAEPPLAAPKVADLKPPM